MFLFNIFAYTKKIKYDIFFVVRGRKMKDKFIKKIPNILTSIRIILSIVSFVLFLNNNFNLGIILLTIAALTDFFDGYFARKLNATSVFGGKLDQLSDKLFEILTCFAGLILGNHYLIITLLFELLFSVIIGVKSLKLDRWFVSSKMGRVKTVFLFITIILGLLVTKFKILKIPFFIVWSITTMIQAYANYDSVKELETRNSVSNINNYNKKTTSKK